MIELRGLHLGNIARSPDESVRPDLWPDHAWVPALGCTGGVVYDLCGVAHMAPVSADYSWPPGSSGIELSGAFNNYDGYPSTLADIIPDRPFCAFSRQSISSPEYQGTWTQYGLCGWATLHRSYRFGIAKGTRPGLFFTIFGRDGNPENLAEVSINPSWWGFSGPVVDTTLIAQWTGSNFIAGAIVGGSVALSSTAWNGGVYQPPVQTIHILGQRDSANDNGVYGANGTAQAWAVLPRAISATEMLALHADPLLPFRRRQPVYYSVPSWGGSSLAASSAWRVFTAAAIDTAWAIRAALAGSTAWAVLTQSGAATSWRIAAASDADTGWRIATDLQAPSAWRVFAESGSPAAWNILTASEADTAWRIATDLNASTAWAILTSLDAATAWAIISAGTLLANTGWAIRTEADADTGWRLKTDTAADTAWAVRNARDAATAWDIQTALAGATAWRIATDLQADTAWTVITDMDADAAWRILRADPTGTAWQVCTDLDTPTSWAVFSDIIPEPVRLFLAPGRQFILNAASRVLIITKTRP